MTEGSSFEKIINALLDGNTPFPPRYLHHFSDVNTTDLDALGKAWPQVPIKRKLSLLEDLNDLAESDTLMSFDNLARYLLKDPLPEVRTSAINLLWESLDRSLVPIYLDILGNDENNDTRAAVASVLGLFIYHGELDELPFGLLHQVEEALISAARSGVTSLVKRRAIESLGASSRPEVNELIELAYKQPGSGWISSALCAMGRSNDNQWNKHVIAHLLNHNEDIRSEAVQAAGKLSIKTAVPVLLDLLEDEEDSEIRREIIWALSEIGGEGIKVRFDELLAAADDDDEAEFLDEALANLSFTEDLNEFDLLDLEIDKNGDENS